MLGSLFFKTENKLCCCGVKVLVENRLAAYPAYFVPKVFM